MNNATVWCIDTTGGIKNIPIHMVAEKEAEGWVLLPSRELGPDNRPKMTYYPQMDHMNATYNDPPKEVQLMERDEVLVVDIV